MGDKERQKLPPELRKLRSQSRASNVLAITTLAGLGAVVITPIVVGGILGGVGAVVSGAVPQLQAFGLGFLTNEVHRRFAGVFAEGTHRLDHKSIEEIADVVRSCLKERMANDKTADDVGDSLWSLFEADPPRVHDGFQLIRAHSEFRSVVTNLIRTDPILREISQAGSFGVRVPTRSQNLFGKSIEGQGQKKQVSIEQSFKQPRAIGDKESNMGIRAPGKPEKIWDKRKSI